MRIFNILNRLITRFLELPNWLKAFIFFSMFSLIFFSGIFFGYYYDQTSFYSIWQPWAGVIENKYTINPVLSDQVDYIIPGIVRFYSDTAFWNKDLAFGVPYGLMLFNGTLYPVNFLLLFLNDQLAISLGYIIRTTLSGTFMYLFLKNLKTGNKASFLIALTYMFTAPAIGFIGVTVGYIVPFIPLYFLSLNKLFDKKFRFKIALLALSTALLITSGFPSVVAFLFIFAGFNFLFQLFLNRKDSPKEPLFYYIFGSVLGFGLCAFFLLPSYEFFQNIDLSYRENYGLKQFPSSNLLLFFNPHFYGNPSFGTWSTRSNILEYALYSGYLSFLLFPLSIILVIKKRITNRYYYIFISSLIVFISFNFLNILSITKELPIFSFNPSTRLCVVLPFFSLTGISYALDYIIKNKNWFKEKLLVSAILIPFLVYLAITAVLPFTRQNEVVTKTVDVRYVLDFFTGQQLFFIPAVVIISCISLLVYLQVFKIIPSRLKKTSFSLGAVFLILFILLLDKYHGSILGLQARLWSINYIIFSLINTLIIVMTIAIFIWIRKLDRKFIFPALALMIFLDLFLYTGFINPPTRAETFFPTTSETEFLKTNLHNNERIMSIDRAFLPNTNEVYNIPSIQAHHITDSNYKLLMQQIDPDYLAVHSTVSYFSENSDLSSDFIDLFNVKYLVTGQNFSPDKQTIAYQNQFNAELQITNEVSQEFKLKRDAQVDQISIRMGQIQINKEINLIITVTDKDGTLFRNSYLINPEKTSSISWIDMMPSDTLSLEKDVKYKLNIKLERALDEQESIVILACQNIDCYRPGKITNNTEYTDITFKLIDNKPELNDKYKLVFAKNENIYENVSSERKDIYQISRIQIIDGQEDFLKKSKDSDLYKTAFLGKEYADDFETLEYKISQSDTIIFTKHKDDFVQLESSFKLDGFILIPDSYYPGWEAYIDGKETKIYRTDLSFRGISIPAGEHTIEMKYQPDHFSLGLAISTLGFITIVSLQLFAFRHVVKTEFGSIKKYFKKVYRKHD
ncbi:MAG: Multidrug resistance protein B [candidate division WS6 bacterium GW2011_GWA2_37_6]|uniref:Multidrug resistance protein B n=1 Tax=candidate division WS6 bacterium GW2011_GWA2_37_6 TaxID=1619087 RepID=A0A0G0HB14_9BACT|nr:MAG: Multidrug resistance protein B [candidate division WS6 bacterium GW2011_GWA2_37_6]